MNAENTPRTSGDATAFGLPGIVPALPLAVFGRAAVEQAVAIETRDAAARAIGGPVDGGIPYPPVTTASGELAQASYSVALGIGKEAGRP